ncbi:MAG TPA: hypothetical protein VM432_11930 [Bdellovibrionales bacterium]|nr:hypothetical protein [Bdellovibrionales bacterium]
MKRIFLSIGTALIATNAYASHFVEYDKAALELANKLLLCPKEVAAIASKPYTTIEAGRLVGGQTPEGSVTQTTIDFVQIMPAPSFHRTEISLSIIERYEKLDIDAPDAPSHRRIVTCRVK